MKIYSGCLLLLGAVGSVEAFQAPIQGNNPVPATDSSTKLASVPKNWKPQVPGNRNTPIKQPRKNLKKWVPGQDLTTPSHSKVQNGAYKEMKAAERRALEMSGLPSYLTTAKMGIPTFKDDITTPRMPGIGSSIPSFASAAAKYSSAGMAGISSYFYEVSGSTCPPPRERSQSQFKVKRSVSRHQAGSKPAGIPSYSDLTALRSGGDPLAGPRPTPVRTGPRVVKTTRAAPAASIAQEPAKRAPPSRAAPARVVRAAPARAAPVAAARAAPARAAPVAAARAASVAAAPQAAGIPSYTSNLSGNAPAGAGKPSYSPFGTKPRAATPSDSLYAPPPVKDEAPAKGFMAPPPPAPAAPAVEKKSFAPFGGAAAGPPSGSGLPSYSSSLGGGAPAGAGKPSYSPFGAKPKAATQDALSGAAPAAPAAQGRPPVDDRIRGAYEQWCQTHNKQFDEDRIFVFEQRFMEAVKHYKATGTAVELNAYADLTPEEYSAQGLS